jgi:hypothetical protein
LKDPNFQIPEIKVKEASPRRVMPQLPRGRYIPPMAPLAARLPQPSHLTSSSTSKPIIDLTEDKMEGVEEGKVIIKQEPQEPKNEKKTWEQLKLRIGGRITTGGPGESSVALRQQPPTTSTAQSKPPAPKTLKEQKEEQWFKLGFTAKDTVRLGSWPQKRPKGAPIPPPLVQVVTLMSCMGQLVETMTGFVLWDTCLVSDEGQIMAESVTVNLNPKFSGQIDL